MPIAAHVAALARARRLAHPSRTGGGKFRPGHTIRARLPKQQLPKAIEADYARELVKIIDVGRRAVAALVKALPKLLESAQAARSDAAPLTRRQVAGLPIEIENPAGSTRHWTDSDGTTGSTVMRWDYGYIDGYTGADGEEVDVYIGPEIEFTSVFVVHQNDKSSGFTEYDEDKCMLGFASAELAIRAYLEQYDDPRFFRGMSRFSVDAFKARLRSAGDAPVQLGNASGWREDASTGQQARDLLNNARRSLDDALDTATLERLARRYGDTTSAFQREQLARQTRAAIGIDIRTLDSAVPAMIEHFVQENVALVKSLGATAISDVEKITTRAFTSGELADDVAKDIAARFDIHERHARLIARDQIGKLSGQVNASRQKEIGITSFIWRTAGDERVRPEHEELEGQTFPYSDPPSEGLPGEPILCRCSAEPVFDDVLDDIMDDGSEDDTDDSESDDASDGTSDQSSDEVDD